MMSSGMFPEAALAEPARRDQPATVTAALQPSEYTASLIQVLRHRASWVRGRRVLEIGAGSGVVLAAASMLGAASVCGVEIEPVAIAAAATLLCELDLVAELLRGDMWQPVAGRRFDLVAANLPHFPMPAQAVAGRLPSWSSGGPDGRLLLDRFLSGLAAHLAPGGRAVITHNGFVGLARSRDALAKFGLVLRIATTALVHIPCEKLDLMTPDVLRAEAGRSLHRYGPHAFADMHVVEIGEPSALA